MTVATDVFAKARPKVEPKRSMTHPLRDPNRPTGKRKAKHGAPLDPEDLSRRLTIYLEEQKVLSGKRNQARALRAATLQRQQQQQDGTYRHIPAVAATSFQRTATPDAMVKVHKLSHPAVKTHLEQSQFEDPRTYSPTILRKTITKDQALIERDLLRNRNQFQWTPAMEEALTADRERDLYKVPQRTFHPETSHVRIRHNVRAPRPMSTGDILSEDEDSHGYVVLEEKLKGKTPVVDARDRNDWVQRDDEIESRHGIKEWSSTLLRKKEPNRMMTAKNEKDGKVDRGNTVVGGGELGSPPPSKGRGFLARFRRFGT